MPLLPDRAQTGHAREEAHMALAISVGAALLLGFLVGLLTFKVKARWCPTCGAYTMTERPAPAQAGAERD
jgi:hypothetical protein